MPDPAPPRAGALAVLSLFNAAHAALAGASAGALALDVLVREARRADHREQARACAGSRQRLATMCTVSGT
jgi:hypothetical protein